MRKEVHVRFILLFSLLSVGFMDIQILNLILNCRRKTLDLMAFLMNLRRHLLRN